MRHIYVAEKDDGKGNNPKPTELIVYNVTEEDVDGNGTNATELISSTAPLTEQEKQTFQECLDDVKQEAADNGIDSDTEDMVSEAMDKFFEKTGLKLEFANGIIADYFTF